MKINPVSYAHLNEMEGGGGGGGAYHERHSRALSPTMRCVDKTSNGYR